MAAAPRLTNCQSDNRRAFQKTRVQDPGSPEEESVGEAEQRGSGATRISNCRNGRETISWRASDRFAPRRLPSGEETDTPSSGMPMIVGLFWPYTRSLLTLLHCSDMGDAYYPRPTSMAGTAAKARPSSVGASSRLGRERAGKGGKGGGQEERWQDTAIELIRSLMDNMVTTRSIEVKRRCMQAIENEVSKLACDSAIRDVL